MVFLIRFIPLIGFFIPTIYAYKEKNNVALVVCGIYLLSAICGLFMDSDILPFHNFENESFFSFLLYTVLLLPFLFLSLRIKPFTNKEYLPKGFTFNTLLFICSFGAFFSIVYLTPYAIFSLRLNASEVRNIIAVEAILPENFFTTIAVGFPTFYFLYSFLLFVCIIQERSKFIILSMLLGVISFVINVLVFSGRDGVLFSSLALLIAFFMFKPLLTYLQIKLIKLWFIILLFFGLLIIAGITAERFGESGGLDFRSLKIGIFGYLGTQPYIFATWIEDNTIFNNGNTVFPLFIDLLGLNTDKGDAYTEQYTWMFGTFLSSFYSINGFFSLFGISFIFWFFFRIRFKILNKGFLLASFFLLGFFFHFTLSGIFYFRMYNKGGNLFILISVISTYLFGIAKNRIFTNYKK
jgi:hypothetical protein